MFRWRKEVTLVKAQNPRVLCIFGNIFVSWIEILNHIQEFINKNKCTIFPPLLWLFHGHYSYQNLSIVEKRKVFFLKIISGLIQVATDFQESHPTFSKTTQFGHKWFLLRTCIVEKKLPHSSTLTSDNHILIDFEFCQKQKRYKHSSAHKQRPFDIARCTIYILPV